MHAFVACPAGILACRYSAGQEAHILFSVSVRAEGEAEELMQRLNSSSMPTINLSNIEAAQVSLQRPARRCIGPISTDRQPLLWAPALLQSFAGCCSLLLLCAAVSAPCITYASQQHTCLQGCL